MTSTSATPAPRPATASAATPKKRAWLVSLGINLGFAAAAIGVAAITQLWIGTLGNPRFLPNLGVVGTALVILALAWIIVDHERVESRVIRGLLLLVFAVLVSLGFGFRWFVDFDWLAFGLAAATLGVWFAIAGLFWLRRRLRR